MKQFDLEKTNIFMKFVINDINEKKESFTFLYSDSKGMEHLNEVLQANQLFSTLLTPIEVLNKMSTALAIMFSYNNYNGIETEKWIGARIRPHIEDGYDFPTELKKWKNKLEQFLGKENIYEVSIPAKEFEEYVDSLINNGISNRDQNILNYIESYRLKLELQNNLDINAVSKRKPKV